MGRQYRIPRKNVELFLLATSTGGDARMRTFSRERVAQWLAEDAVDEDTEAEGERLLATLRTDQ
jgi:hypothetical protein